MGDELFKSFLKQLEQARAMSPAQQLAEQGRRLRKELEDFKRQMDPIRGGGYGGIMPVFGTFPSMPSSSSSSSSAPYEPEESKVQEEPEEESILGDRTPESIYEALRKFVIGQDIAAKALATAAYYHYKRIEIQDENADAPKMAKTNVLLLGPTGSGKTYIVEQLAKILDVPFTTVDCTELSPEGYVGKSPDHFIKDLKQQDDELWECGIVFLDEIDKLGSFQWGPEGQAIGRRATSFKTTDIQQALLKLLEGREISQERQWGRDGVGHSGNMLFIAGGAFSGMSEYIDEIVPDDIINYGLMPELVGRFPCITKLDGHTTESLKRVLKESKDSLLEQYRLMFESVGIDIEFSEEAVEKIAEAAAYSGTGARALVGIMERICRELMFRAPSNEELERVIVCEDMVEARLGVLN